MSDKKSLILDKTGIPFQLSSSEIESAAQENFTGLDAVSISQVLNASDKPARSRFEIYQTYSYMMDDPIIHTALNLHITQSLGAHETTNEVFFIEANADASAAEKKIIEELKRDLVPQINRIAYQMAYTGTGYGDSYARIYGNEKDGVKRIEMNDLLLPPLVQPMVRAGADAGYIMSFDGGKDHAFTVLQIARLKMPRMGIVPQHRMLYNAWKNNIIHDDLDNHLPMPDTVGGSFLQGAERPFFLLQNALLGMSSSRIADAVRESLVTLNMEGMTKNQKEKFYNSVISMLQTSKRRVSDAIKSNKPITEKIMHVIPVSSEKQLVSVDNASMSGSGSAQGYNVDDVMFYAKLLAAVLGHDLSMLGFADILSGGLGDGGFYRVSAQGAQRAILIRQGFTDFVNKIIDVHCQYKYKGIFSERPYEVTFIGAQSALEKEKQDTQERRAVAAATVLQAFTQIKEAGFGEAATANFMRRQMNFDEDDAEMYAKELANAPDPNAQENGEDQDGGKDPEATQEPVTENEDEQGQSNEDEK